MRTAWEQLRHGNPRLTLLPAPQAYNASGDGLDGARVVGNFPLLPFNSSVRGPAPQPGQSQTPENVPPPTRQASARSARNG